MASSTFFTFSILSFLLVSQASFNLAEPDGCYIKAIYSLGDSIADTGNLLHMGGGGAFAPITHLPYGETFFEKPTGRCSNGLLMIDYLALALNLPLVNPYLNKDANFNHGVNFAVSGAIALDESFFVERGLIVPYTNSSLIVQLAWFKTHLNSICSSKIECAQKLERALFLVGEIGGNDYNSALFQGRSLEEVMSYVPYVVQSIVNAAKEVIDVGAIQLVVPGNFPIGCMPSHLTMLRSMDHTAYEERKCLKGLNTFAMFHNTKLQEALEELRQAYPHVLIMYADYYNAFMHLLNNASSLGFEESSLLKACCGSTVGEFNFEMTKMCGTLGTSACSNPSQRISWDGIHLTQEAYKIMAQSLMIGGLTYPSYGVEETWRCQ